YKEKPINRRGGRTLEGIPPKELWTRDWPVATISPVQPDLTCKLTFKVDKVTSLANPLACKLEEWRRTLTQLEKDRTRQTKRARAELKRAVSEASRWQKKAAKCGTSTANLAPGVGHGILPSSAAVGSKAGVVAAQAANAAREVQCKTEQVEAAEKSAVRSLMLEERGRFCFFLSCLLPVLVSDSPNGYPVVSC
ncbi:unnamed protein product, partial [Echinostoma caproni]|uniref:Remorin_C domain-containing protein n=1 Tax=Echinostoma caproni TaxID=27848 RepID=A0A183B687_9TREM